MAAAVWPIGSFSEADDKPVMAGEKPVMEEVKIK